MSDLKSKFSVGEKVTKVTGDYSFNGVVRSVFKKEYGQIRLVVEDDAGILHIYNENNLRPIGNNADHQYLNILKKILERGEYTKGRNGGVRRLFGEQMRFDLSDGFPILTTKKVHFKSIVAELLWFLRGDTNIKFLHEHGVTIWDEWADENGDLGPVYGAQWRNFNGVDQINNVIKSIKLDPYSRRHIVTAWNPAEIDDMALPPCHAMFQFFVSEGKLSCHLYQRSADWFLGVPFNIASYALLTHIVARECGLEAGEFIHSFGDLHVYEEHVPQALEQLDRAPYVLPKININRKKSMGRLEVADFFLSGYQHHPAIKAPVFK